VTEKAIRRASFLSWRREFIRLDLATLQSTILTPACMIIVINLGSTIRASISNHDSTYILCLAPIWSDGVLQS
jgi:hypothetical protein